MDITSNDIDYFDLGYNTAAAKNNNQDLTDEEIELKNANALDYLLNNGSEAYLNKYLSAQAGRKAFANDNNLDRSWEDATTDSALGVGQGLINSVGGLAALATSAIDKDAARKVTEATTGASNFLDQYKSSDLKRKQQAVQAMNQMSERDNNRRYINDIANGVDTTRAKLRREGRNVLSNIGNQNSATLADIGAQGAGSLLPGGVVSKGVRGLAGLAKIGEKAASKASWPIAIGALEGGGGYTQGEEEILSMPNSELLQYPEFAEKVDDLIAKGHFPQEALEIAKTDLAHEVGLKTAGASALAAVALSKFSKWAEKPFSSTPTIAKGFVNTASETGEEGLTGVSSKLASNYAIRDTIDPNKDIFEGTGSELAENALGGAFSAGPMQVPAFIHSAGKAVQSKAKNIDNNKSFDHVATDENVNNLEEATNKAEELADTDEFKGYQALANEPETQIPDDADESQRKELSKKSLKTSMAKAIYMSDEDSNNLSDASKKLLEGSSDKSRAGVVRTLLKGYKSLSTSDQEEVEEDIVHILNEFKYNYKNAQDNIEGITNVSEDNTLENLDSVPTLSPEEFTKTKESAEISQEFLKNFNPDQDPRQLKDPDTLQHIDSLLTGLENTDIEQTKDTNTILAKVANLANNGDKQLASFGARAQEIINISNQSSNTDINTQRIQYFQEQRKAKALENTTSEVSNVKNSFDALESINNAFESNEILSHIKDKAQSEISKGLQSEINKLKDPKTGTIDEVKAKKYVRYAMQAMKLHPEQLDGSSTRILFSIALKNPKKFGLTSKDIKHISETIDLFNLHEKILSSLPESKMKNVSREVVSQTEPGKKTPSRLSLDKHVTNLISAIHRNDRTAVNKAKSNLKSYLTYLNNKHSNMFQALREGKTKFAYQALNSKTKETYPAEMDIKSIDLVKLMNKEHYLASQVATRLNQHFPDMQIPEFNDVISAKEFEDIENTIKSVRNVRVQAQVEAKNKGLSKVESKKHVEGKVKKYTNTLIGKSKLYKKVKNTPSKPTPKVEPKVEPKQNAPKKDTQVTEQEKKVQKKLQANEALNNLVKRHHGDPLTSNFVFIKPADKADLQKITVIDDSGKEVTLDTLVQKDSSGKEYIEKKYLGTKVDEALLPISINVFDRKSDDNFDKTIFNTRGSVFIIKQPNGNITNVKKVEKNNKIYLITEDSVFEIDPSKLRQVKGLLGVEEKETIFSYVVASVKENIKSWFVSANKNREDFNNDLKISDSILEKLDDPEWLKQTLGDNTPTDEEVKALKILINNIKKKLEPVINDIVSKEAIKTAEKDNVKREGFKNSDKDRLITDGGVALTPRGKIYNFATITKSGKVIIHPAILDRAALALAQYLLVAGKNKWTFKKEDVARAMGIKESQVTSQMMNLYRKSTSQEVMNQQLTKYLKEFLGIKTTDNAYLGLANGAVQDLAQLLLQATAIADPGLITTTQVRLTENLEAKADAEERGEEIEETEKFITFTFINLKDSKTLGFNSPDVISNRNLLSNVFFKESDRDFNTYFGKNKPRVAKKIHGTDLEVSDEQIEQEKNQNKLKYYADESFIKFIMSFPSAEDYADFRGYIVDPLTQNEEQQASNQARRDQLIEEYNEVFHAYKNLLSYAKVNGTTPEKVARHFGFNITRFARINEQGTSSPLMHKLIRAAWRPGLIEMDFDPSTKEGQQNIKLRKWAQAQALGAHINQKSFEATEASLQEKLDLLDPYIEDLVEWQKANEKYPIGSPKLSAVNIDYLSFARSFRNLTGEKLTDEIVNVLIDEARFRIAKEKGLTKFSTNLIIEADGVAHGTGATLLQACGIPESAWFDNVMRGGISIGALRSAAQSYKDTGADTYTHEIQLLGKKLPNYYQHILERSKEGNRVAINSQFQALYTLLDIVFNGVNPEINNINKTRKNQINLMLSKETDNFAGISRAVMKEQGKVQVYKASAETMAQRVVGVLIDELYDRLNYAASFGPEKFASIMFPGVPQNVAEEQLNVMFRALNKLTTSKLVIQKNGNSWIKEFKRRESSISKFSNRSTLPNANAKLTFTDFEKMLLVNNVTEMLSKPSKEAIDDLLGHSVVEYTDTIVNITGGISSVAQLAFTKLFEQKLKEKEDQYNNDPANKGKLKRRNHWGLSKNEIQEVLEEMVNMGLLPIYTLAGNHQVESYKQGSVKSSIKTTAPIQGSAKDLIASFAGYLSTLSPQSTGVSLVPGTIIASGDATMSRDFINDPKHPNANLVFDGIEMLLKDIVEGVELANRVELNSYLNDNPIKNYIEAQKTFMENLQKESTKKFIIDLLSDPNETKRKENFNILNKQYHLYKVTDPEEYYDSIVDFVKNTFRMAEEIKIETEAFKAELRKANISNANMAGGPEMGYKYTPKNGLSFNYEEDTNGVQTELSRKEELQFREALINRAINASNKAKEAFEKDWNDNHSEKISLRRLNPYINEEGISYSNLDVSEPIQTVSDKSVTPIKETPELTLNSPEQPVNNKLIDVLFGNNQFINSTFGVLFSNSNFAKTKYAQELKNDIIKALSKMNISIRFITPDTQLEERMDAEINGFVKSNEDGSKTINIVYRKEMPINTIRKVFLHELLHALVFSSIENYARNPSKATNIYLHNILMLSQNLLLSLEKSELTVDSPYSSVLDFLSKNAITLKNGNKVLLVTKNIDSTTNEITYQINKDEVKNLLNVKGDRTLEVLLHEIITYTATDPSKVKFLKTKAFTKKLPFFSKLTEFFKGVLDNLKGIVFGKQASNVDSLTFLDMFAFDLGGLIKESANSSTNSSDPSVLYSMSIKDPRLSELNQEYKTTFEKAKVFKPAYETTKEENIARQAKLVEKTITSINDTNIERENLKNLGFNLSNEQYEVFFNIYNGLQVATNVNSAALIDAQAIYSYAMKAFAENNDLTDNQFNYLANRGKDKKDTLSLFIALASVSDNLRDKLAKLEIPAKELKTDCKLDALVCNLGKYINKSLNHALGSQDIYKNRNLLNSLDKAVNNINNKIARQALISRDESSIELLNDNWSNVVREDSRLTKRLQSVKEHQGIIMASIDAVIASLANPDVANKAITFTLGLNKFTELLIPLYRDMFGTDSYGRDVEGNAKIAKSTVQQVRQRWREGVPANIKKLFKGAKDSDFSLMTKAFAESDIVALGSYNISDIKKYLKDPDALTSSFEQDIRNLVKDSSLANSIISKADEVSDFTMTGKVHSMQLRNAYAVANLFGSSKNKQQLLERYYKKHGVSKADVIDTINKYISAKNLSYLSNAEKARLNDLMDKYSEGVNTVIGNLYTVQKVELNNRNALTDANHYKGYTPRILEENQTLKVVKTNSPEAKACKELGYELLRKDDTFTYYYLPVTATAPFNQGGFQNAYKASMGVSTLTGYSLFGNAIKMSSDGVSARVNKINPEGIPVFDRHGNLKAIESLPVQSPSVKYHSDVTELLGMQYGRLYEAKEGEVVNQTLLELLHKMWKEEGGKGNPNYINLYDPHIDPALKEAFAILSPDVKKSAEELFGKDYFPVRKDLALDIIGARRMSVGNLFTGNVSIHPAIQNVIRRFMRLINNLMNKNGYKYALILESGVQKVAAYARNYAVIKSGTVSVWNAISNVLQLMYNGVPLTKVIPLATKYVKELENYNNIQNKITELYTRKYGLRHNKRAYDALSARIESLEKVQKRLDIYPLIQAGEYTSVMDIGLKPEEINFPVGKIGDKVEYIMESIPEAIKPTVKNLLITRDTNLYQGLAKFAQYGDVVSKAILYDYLTSKKTNPVSPKEALEYVRDQFINYEQHPGRFREYLENMGLLWFWNYKLRSIKSIIGLMRRNPLFGLIGIATTPFTASLGCSTLFTDNILVKALTGSLLYSIGPGMLAFIPFMGPLGLLLS